MNYLYMTNRSLSTIIYKYNSTQKVGPMIITHKIFLYWLLYVTTVLFAISIAVLLGLPQLVISHDHSYLSILLIGMYIITEVLSGYRSIWISSLHRTVFDTAQWLKTNKLKHIETDLEGSALELVNEHGDGLILKDTSPFTQLIIAMKSERANNSTNGNLDSMMLMEAFAENLARRSSICSFMATRIVWVGILATIVGVIIAFWPFQQAGMTIDMMRENIAQFFSGVAVAFIPTAVSFVFKIALDFNSAIVDNGVSEIIESAANSSATYIIPYLESDNK